MQTKDTLNYYLSCYILSGLSGDMPKEPFLNKLGVENIESKQNNDKNRYEYKKAKFLEQMSKVNKNFKGKENNNV